MDFSDLSLEAVVLESESDLEYLEKVIDRRTDAYTSCKIKKRNGGMRTLKVPDDRIRPVQTWVLKNVLESVAPHNAAFAYTAGRSVPKCAEKHLGAKWLLRMDLTSFYDSIDERSVYYMFLKEFGMSKVMSFQLARLVTSEDSFAEPYVSARVRPYSDGDAIRLGRLPQGAATSGAIANLVSKGLDKHVSALARVEGLIYSRYADDLFLSSHEPHERSFGSQVIGRVTDLARLSGFTVNEAKTKLSTNGSPLRVLGLHVGGDSLRLSKQFRKRLDGHLRALRVFGLNRHAAYSGHLDSRFLLAEIEGLLGYANDVSKSWARPRWEEFERFLKSDGIARHRFSESSKNSERFYREARDAV